MLYNRNRKTKQNMGTCKTSMQSGDCEQESSSIFKMNQENPDAFSYNCLQILALTCTVLYNLTFLTSKSSFLRINYASVPIQPTSIN